MKALLALLLLAASSLLFGQAGNDPANPDGAETDENAPYSDGLSHNRFWSASLPGGHYMVALDRIASVSKHEYLLDGNLIITEVNIDTVGNSLVRIYQITPAAEYGDLSAPAKVVERGKELLDRAGQRTGVDLNSMVHKTYPVTTHTKTIEFRVSERAVLDALLASVQRSWSDGKGRNFVVK